MTSASVDAWPTRPQESEPSSDVGQLHATIVRCEKVKIDAEARYLAVTREYDQHQHVIEQVRPGCDWQRVATAEAAVRHLKRFVDTAARELRTAQDAVIAAENDLNRTWRHYLQVRGESGAARQLRVGGFIEDAQRDRERELRRLVGSPTA